MSPEPDFIVIESKDGSFVYTRPEQVQTISERCVDQQGYVHQSDHYGATKYTHVSGPNLSVDTPWTPQQIIELVTTSEANQ